MLIETSGPKIDVFEHDEERNGATLVLPSSWLRLSSISFSPIPTLKTMQSDSLGIALDKIDGSALTHRPISSTWLSVLTYGLETTESAGHARWIAL